MCFLYFAFHTILDALITRPNRYTLDRAYCSLKRWRGVLVSALVYIYEVSLHQTRYLDG